MKYWENGFFLEQNEQNTRKEISDETWRELLEAQSNGMEIYTDDNGLPQVREHIKSNEEIKQNRIDEIKQRLTAISEDIIQDQVGEFVIDLSTKKQEFITLHNELRSLLGKQPRNIK
jgi:hypothetical protein